MIETGIVKEILFDENRINVRVPIFETAADKPVILKCRVMNTPGILEGYQPEDKVYVDFENNDLSYPIVLGKVLKTENKSSSAKAEVNGLLVTDNAVLPTNTKIGDITYDALYNMFKTVIESTTSIEELRNLKDVASEEDSKEVTDTTLVKSESKEYTDRKTQAVKETLDKLEEKVTEMRGWLTAMIYPNFQKCEPLFKFNSDTGTAQLKFTYQLKSIDKDYEAEHPKTQYIGITMSIRPHYSTKHSLDNKDPGNPLWGMKEQGTKFNWAQTVSGADVEKETTIDWKDIPSNFETVSEYYDSVSTKTFIPHGDKYTRISSVLPDKLILTIGLYTDQNLQVPSMGTEAKVIEFYNTTYDSAISPVQMLINNKYLEGKDQWIHESAITGFKVRKVANDLNTPFDSSYIEEYYTDNNFDWYLYPIVDYGSENKDKDKISGVYMDLYINFEYLDYTPDISLNNIPWIEDNVNEYWVHWSGYLHKQLGFNQLGGRIQLLSDSNTTNLDGQPLSDRFRKQLTGFMRWYTESSGNRSDFYAAFDSARIKEIYCDYRFVTATDDGNYMQKSFINSAHYDISENNWPQFSSNRQAYDILPRSDTIEAPVNIVDDNSSSKWSSLNDTAAPTPEEVLEQVDAAKFKENLIKAVKKISFGYGLVANNGSEKNYMVKPLFYINLENNVGESIKLNSDTFDTFYHLSYGNDSSDFPRTFALDFELELKAVPFVKTTEKYKEYPDIGWNIYSEATNFKQVNNNMDFRRALYSKSYANHVLQTSSLVGVEDETHNDKVHCCVIFDINVKTDQVFNIKSLVNCFQDPGEIKLQSKKDDYLDLSDVEAFQAKINQAIFKIENTVTKQEVHTDPDNQTKEIPVYTLPDLSGDLLDDFMKLSLNEINKFISIELTAVKFRPLAGNNSFKQDKEGEIIKEEFSHCAFNIAKQYDDHHKLKLKEPKVGSKVSQYDYQTVELVTGIRQKIELIDYRTGSYENLESQLTAIYPK